MKYGYARVSTKTQDLKTQITRLEEAICDRVFSDKLSGKNRKRPQLEEMLGLLKKGDSVVVAKLDRLGRSTLDVCKIAQEIAEAEANLVFLDQGIDTSTATGKMMFQMLAVIAEFERSLITQRTQEGRAAAMKAGKKMGRTPRTTAKQNEQMVEMYKQGKSWNDIAETFDVNRMTVYRRIKHLIGETKLAP